MAATPDIAVLGNFVVDLIARPFDRLPERGQLLLLDTLETHAGGNGPNTSGALAKLGGAVTVLGRVGDDLYGRFLLERLQGWGTQTDLVTRDAAATTGLTIVPVDHTGERSFVHQFGVNAHTCPDDFPWDRLTSVRHLHLGSFFVLPKLDGEPAAAVLAEARRRGMSTSLDFCWDRDGRWLDLLEPCLPHVDLLLPSETEARCLTRREAPEAMAAFLREKGCRTVIIKLGEQGCFYSGAEGAFRVPAFAVAVRDTTGAGDSFIAGLLYARGQGWELARTLRFANACGARAVTAIGAVTAVCPAVEIEDWSRGLAVRE